MSAFSGREAQPAPPSDPAVLPAVEGAGGKAGKKPEDELVAMLELEDILAGGKKKSSPGGLDYADLPPGGIPYAGNGSSSMVSMSTSGQVDVAQRSTRPPAGRRK